MTAFAQHFSFELRTGIRNKNLLLMNYLFPLGFYLMIGFIMPTINPAFLEAMVPAMVTFAILAATLLGIPDPLVNAREAGIFRSYKINGVPAGNILIMPALTTMLHLSMVTLIIVVTAPILFGAPLPINWLAFVLVFLVTALACTGLGVLIGVISPSTRLTVLYSQVIFIPSMILGGLMLPYEFLPEGAQLVAQLLPATQAMNAFLGLAMGETAVFNPWLSVIILFTAGILALGLGRYLFTWDSRNATRVQQRWLGLLVFLPYVLGIILQGLPV